MLKRRDFILIGSLLLLSLALLFAVRMGGKQGGEAVVRVGGEVQGRYPLSVDGVFVLNGGTNTLCIENGAARIMEADCPDQVCVRQGRVNKTGQVITCLPNRLTVSIEGGEEGEVLAG